MSTESERPLRQDAARNRERLIAAARRAFADSGPDVPLEEIARAAGVSRTTLYRNFETREQLAAEIYTDNMDRIVHRAAELAGRPDGLVALVDFVLDIQLSGNQGLARVMIPGSDRALALALGGRFRAALEPLLEVGRRAGVLRPEVDVEDVMLAFPMAAAGFSLGSEEASRRARRMVHRALFATAPG
ncbi:TetR/AcrR family transcriptional regulator [Blastococcus sp. URHD0036]|uniref:TetR/AcrR family transcriptional regulator n=1 Tax=Blastococcus sp. URHD0036 TaxID=1380356 RepID=UPI00068F8111|nr:TetR/AcrR family transcriptional regulator [Blastococcus sp. URHD0036]